MPVGIPRSRGGCPGRRGGTGRPVGLRRAAPLVGEVDAVGIVGISADAEPAPVVKPVMSLAKSQQIGGIGGAAVLPMAARGGRAATGCGRIPGPGNPGPAPRSPSGCGRARCGRPAPRSPACPPDSITGRMRASQPTKRRSPSLSAGPRWRCPPVAPSASVPRGAAPGDGRGGDGTAPRRPASGRPPPPGRRPSSRRRGRDGDRIVLAGPEQLLPGGRQGLLHQGALVGRQPGRQPPRALVVVPKLTRRGSSGALGRASAVLGSSKE